MRDEMLKRLDDFVVGVGIDENGQNTKADAAWRAIRDEIEAERCENCLHWTAKLPEGENRPGTCCGWRTGMFSIESADECDAGVFWTWSDFGCKCFKPKTREA
jgi:hypothetical protein